MTTSTREIDEALLKAAQQAEKLTIRMLSYLGEATVAYARGRSAAESWIDRTGNLRSSVGYVIVVDGKVEQLTGFKEILGGSEGVKTGKDLALELANQYTKAYALIVVAGMRYAELVEAIESKDVLAGPELFARRKLPEMEVKLNSQIARIIA
ncbi:MAG: hypothetical protein LBK45_02915 [Tannerellaceae bacterium]|nr:hypothetical protein [Tannerellaceae bacterium]